MNEGWIKLHRKLLDSAVFSDERLLKVWIWCLLRANHTRRRIVFDGMEVEIKKGQFIFGRKVASKELNMPESTVYRKMKNLEKLENLNSKANNKFTIVEVRKWHEYQGLVNSRMNNKWTTNGHKQECKNVRKIRMAKGKSFCSYEGVAGDVYSSLATEELKRCGCPRCQESLEFREQSR